MNIAAVTREGDHLSVHLPKEIHLAPGSVSVRQEGELVILQPLRPSAWPEGFFDDIQISDPSFERPNQGELPPLEVL